MPVDLPFMADQPTASARIKVSPEHFKVDEVLGFEPDGTGQHTCFRFLRSTEIPPTLRASCHKCLACD